MWKRYRRHGHLSEAQQHLKALEYLLSKHLSLGQKEGFGRMDGDTIPQEDISTLCVIYIWEVEKGVSVGFRVTALRVTMKEIWSCWLGSVVRKWHCPIHRTSPFLTCQ